MDITGNAVVTVVKDVVLIGSFALVGMTQRTLLVLTDHVSKK
ncbi:Hypothetical protein PMT_2900 [Prochlorococcus marinus str. MIT 9313]|uniref:Uncharacterized protein n=1 Tax=Prochlorococcus marinus (strain MIT 9313) TaxID=74547 RepID=B9ESR4_PROMM|nr:Hypothetical protein PMT_2900 [Prochlorococcus marinus str. MIT 9313]